MISAFLLMSWVTAEPVPTTNAAALKKEQEQCWAELDRNDFPLVLKATLRLSVHPKETVQFLNVKMMPLKIEKDEAKKRIRDLDSDDENIWKPAFEKLAYYDPRLAMSVKDAYETVSTGPGQKRLMAIFAGQQADHYEGQSIRLKSEDELFAYFQSGGHGWGVFQKVDMLTMRWIRLNRSITLLEHIGSTEAIDVLKKMSKGHIDAVPTKAAKAALKRLKVD